MRREGEMEQGPALQRMLQPWSPWRRFPIGGGGECVYLNGVSSLRCTSERHWICTKPDAFTQAQEAAIVGGS
ncbi:unnamed protein product [Caretta caretta]